MPESLKDIIYVISGLLALGSMAYTWIAARSRGNSEDLGKLGKSLDEVDKRLAKVEGEMVHLPTKEAQQEMAVSMERLSGDFRAMQATMVAQSNTIDSVHEFLMNKG